MSKKTFFHIVVAMLAMLLAACNENLAAERAEKALNAGANDPIYIGLGWPIGVDRDLLPEAVEMAVEEINQSGGLLDGRQIEIVPKDDHDSAREGRLIAQSFAEDTNVVAVIGHFWSYISVPASALYEFNGILMLTPASTSPELTSRGFEHVFRSITNDNEVGRQMAVYADDEGFERMVILYVNDSYGRALSNAFENEADKLGITIVDRRSYRGSERSFRGILDDWETSSFDAILVIGGAEAATFIRLARESGISAPILAGDGLDTDELWAVAGDAANGVIVVTHFHPDNPYTEQDFIQRFEERYGTAPDTWAAQGYDAVYLLANAIENAGSTMPDEMAAALRNTHDWEGVTGPHTFDENGDTIGKPVVLKVMRDGQFEFLELATEERCCTGSGE